MHSWPLSVSLLTLPQWVVKWVSVSECGSKNLLCLALLFLCASWGQTAHSAKLVATVCPDAFPSLRKSLPQTCKPWSERLSNLLNLGILLEQVFLSNVLRIIPVNECSTNHISVPVCCSILFLKWSCVGKRDAIYQWPLRDLNKCVPILFYHQIMLYLYIY